MGYIFPKKRPHFSSWALSFLWSTPQSGTTEHVQADTPGHPRHPVSIRPSPRPDGGPSSSDPRATTPRSSCRPTSTTVEPQRTVVIKLVDRKPSCWSGMFKYKITLFCNSIIILLNFSLLFKEEFSRKFSFKVFKWCRMIHPVKLTFLLFKYTFEYNLIQHWNLSKS